jgi:hypothetical protein
VDSCKSESAFRGGQGGMLERDDQERDAVVVYFIVDLLSVPLIVN